MKLKMSHAFIIVALIMVAGCRTTDPPSLTRDQMDSRPESGELKLGAGDEIATKFAYNPELDDEQIIRPDGRINLPLVGEVMAAGKTTAELEQELRIKYQSQLTQPQVSIVVRKFYSRRVFVAGSVNRQGEVQMPASLTALEAILLAGGFENWSADKTHVIVIRNMNGQHVGCALDLKPAVEGRESEPFYLKPLDIVYVSPTPISHMNQWVEQHINRLLPRFGMSINSAGDVGFFR